ncbi:MAG: methyltransferase [Deltaproteobacteria bacterium]|nr:methyltransferase [Deltaproteobacteria bacterium]
MVSLPDIERALHRLYIAAPGASLRREERKKTLELAGMMKEIDRIVSAAREKRPWRMIDAAAGKAYVGLLAAELVLARKGRAGRLVLIERDGARAAACRRAAACVHAPRVDISVRQSDVADASAWPSEPDLVVALHACGPASDEVIRQSVACRARRLLLVPCCTSKQVAAAQIADRWMEDLGLPRHAEIRRRFVQAVVDGERTLVLEAAGYETVVLPFVPPTVTPHNLLWRARRVGEPRRMAEAAKKLARLRGAGEASHV